MRRLLLVCSLLLLGLLGGSTLLWRWAEAQLQRGYERWQAQIRQAGWIVTSGPVTRGGWPLAATLRLPDLHVTGGGTLWPGGLDWRGTTILRASILHPQSLALEPGGAQIISLGGSPGIRLTAGNLQIRLAPEADGAVLVNILGHNLAMEVPGTSQSAGIAELTVQGSWNPQATNTGHALTLSIRAEAIALPSDQPWPLGPRLSSLSLDGAITGPLPPGRPLAAQLAIWRQAGGTISIQHLALGWGPLGVSGTGKAGLNHALQPQGDAQIRLLGVPETLDALTQSGIVSQRVATAIKGVAMLLAQPSGPEGSSDIAVPVALRDEVLSVAGIPVWHAPIVSWQLPDQ